MHSQSDEEENDRDVARIRMLDLAMRGRRKIFERRWYLGLYCLV